jgi:predicted nucleic acid-binding protein
MKSVSRPLVIYWDASAILSTLIEDKHSSDAQYWVTQEGMHFMSTLSCSETYAVLHRMRRERQLAKEHILAALKALKSGPWRHLNIIPEWPMIKKLSIKWSLRGADLWHLAVTKTFQKEITEVLLLTYDAKLKVAAQGENIVLAGEPSN